MAVGATHRTTAAGGSDSSFNTSSFASVSNDLIIAFVTCNKAGPAIPTLTSAHGTWSSVLSVTSGNNRLSCFSCVSNGNSGALTIDFAGSTHQYVIWSITEFNTQNGIVQVLSNTGTSTAPTVTLAAFENALNATVGGIYSWANPAVGSGFTQLGEDLSTIYLNSEWRADNDTTVDWSQASAVFLAIALELREASVPLPATGFFTFM
jgi:hypothetical protein